MLIASSAIVLVAGCSRIPFVGSSDPSASDPEAPIRAYFDLASKGQYDRARDVLSASFQARLGDAGVRDLRSFSSAQVTDVADAVKWANGLGAQLPAPPADKREYLVTVDVSQASGEQASWSNGENRRFVDVVWRDGRWQIENVDKTPGELITGKPPASAATGGIQVDVIAPQTLRLGPAPVDRYIYIARQHAVDLGQIPWAVDPVDVVHRDGPSFGISASDQATLLGKTSDPVTLVPQANVFVQHGNQPLVVIVEQPIKTGPGGVWAIAEVRVATPAT
jgi:hypothetical protein